MSIFPAATKELHWNFVDIVCQISMFPSLSDLIDKYLQHEQIPKTTSETFSGEHFPLEEKYFEITQHYGFVI